MGKRDRYSLEHSPNQALWKRTPFGKLQALPKDGKPITSWRNRDSAFANVAEGIADAVEYILENSSSDTVEEEKEEETLVTVQPRSPILKNPFDISRPVRGRMFFGRSEELKVMQRELCDSKQGKALIVYGPRRSGKSSLCINFLERQVRPPFWSVFFSLQNAIQQNEETILMQQLLNCLAYQHIVLDSI